LTLSPSGPGSGGSDRTVAGENQNRKGLALDEVAVSLLVGLHLDRRAMGTRVFWIDGPSAQ
jgi:hypothetical protein